MSEPSNQSINGEIEDTLERIMTTIEIEEDPPISILSEVPPDETISFQGLLDLRLDGSEYDICNGCNSHRLEVNTRVYALYGNQVDSLSQLQSGGYVCQSCTYDGRKCCFCGISEDLLKDYIDGETRFYEITDTFAGDGGARAHIYCEECYHLNGVLSDMDTSTNDGFPGPNELCMFCRGDHDSQDCPSLSLNNLRDDNGAFDVYEIDTEGDPSLLEDDTDTSSEIKTGLKDLMDMFFEVKGYIPNGNYISLMDKMKDIYDRL